jgi:arsenite methyltransferase
MAGVDVTELDNEALPAADAGFDCVISNGVINLSPDEKQVFAEAARVLRPGGRVAIADIVTEQQLTESIVCNPDLWASCIGGASQQDAYRQAIEDAGLCVQQFRPNWYQFLSARARDASATYGVRSISVLAVKPAP